MYVPKFRNFPNSVAYYHFPPRETKNKNISGFSTSGPESIFSDHPSRLPPAMPETDCALRVGKPDKKLTARSCLHAEIQKKWIGQDHLFVVVMGTMSVFDHQNGTCSTVLGIRSNGCPISAIFRPQSRLRQRCTPPAAMQVPDHS